MSDSPPFFTLLRGGEVYDPEPVGVRDILVGGERILRVAERIDESGLVALGVPYEVVDASGQLVTPGLIDPHQHINGAGGEKGFASRTQPVRLEELVTCGITTVVGVLGADSTTRGLRDLYGKVKELEALGMSAYMYTGGYPCPPPTLSGSVRDDLVLFDVVIGVGEMAISDTRSLEPTQAELTHVVGDALVGGSLGGKAGVAHFHVGDGTKYLQCLNMLLDNQDTPPDHLYPTHVNRNDELLQEAVKLVGRGTWADMDTVDGGLGKQLRRWLELGGTLDRLTVSTDNGAEGAAAHKLWRELRACVQSHDFALEEVLPLATTNTAKALRLDGKGRVFEGDDADLLVLDRATLEIAHVFARGQQLVENGRMVKRNGK